MADMDVMTPAEANPQNVQDLTVFVSTCLFVGVMVVVETQRGGESVRLLLIILAGFTILFCIE